MDAINTDSSNLSTIYRVRDPFRLLKTLILLLVVGAITGLIDYGLIRMPSNKFPWDSLFAKEYIWQTATVISLNLLTIGILFRLKALWSGVKVNLDAATIEFPGGSVSANDFIDYFLPKFLFQYFLRTTLDLNSIRQLSTSVKRDITTNNGNVKVYERFAININGSFGAASVWFDSEGKRDEIYSAIRQLNRMGDAIFRA